VLDQGLTTKREMRVETAAGVIVPRVEDNGQVTVDMGAPCFDPRVVPVPVRARAAHLRVARGRHARGGERALDGKPPRRPAGRRTSSARRSRARARSWSGIRPSAARERGIHAGRLALTQRVARLGARRGARRSRAAPAPARRWWPASAWGCSIPRCASPRAAASSR
jgi:hypothetical protein